jgi:hypothetical protein
MLQVIALLWVALYLFGCVALITLSERWNWFVAAVGVLLLGQAVGQFAMNAHLTRIGRCLGVSFWRAYRLKLLANVLSGTLAMIGALITLDRAFGLIVAFGAFCWVWFWGCLLVQFRHLNEPCLPASPDRVA